MEMSTSATAPDSFSHGQPASRLTTGVSFRCFEVIAAAEGRRSRDDPDVAALVKRRPAARCRIVPAR